MCFIFIKHRSHNFWVRTVLRYEVCSSISSVQLLSHVWLFVTPWIACSSIASLYIIVSFLPFPGKLSGLPKTLCDSDWTKSRILPQQKNQKLPFKVVLIFNIMLFYHNVHFKVHSPIHLKCIWYFIFFKIPIR